jgi:hypothetical protein
LFARGDEDGDGDQSPVVGGLWAAALAEDRLHKQRITSNDEV